MKGNLRVLRKQQGACIKRGEEDEKTEGEIEPNEKGYEEIEGAFECPCYRGQAGIYACFLNSRLVLTPPNAKF